MWCSTFCGSPAEHPAGLCDHGMHHAVMQEVYAEWRQQAFEEARAAASSQLSLPEFDGLLEVGHTGCRVQGVVRVVAVAVVVARW